MHYLQCTACTAMHALQCTHCNALQCIHYLPAAHALPAMYCNACTACNALKCMHYLQCTAMHALPALQGNALDALLHLRCICTTLFIALWVAASLQVWLMTLTLPHILHNAQNTQAFFHMTLQKGVILAHIAFVCPFSGKAHSSKYKNWVLKKK